MKQWVIRSIAVLAVLGGGWCWYSSSQSADNAVRYVSEDVMRGSLEATVGGSGNVIVDQVANIDPTISGTVENLSVKVGDSVQKGQLLFTIVNDQLGVSAQKAAVSLRQAQVAIDSAEVDIQSAKASFSAAENNTSSSTKKQREVLKNKIDIARTNADIARENYGVSLLDYKRQLSDADKRKVTAPFSGTVNAVNVKNGDDLGKTSSNGNDPAIIIGDLQTLRASVQVNEVDIARVHLGQKAVLTLDALNDTKLTGSVEAIDALGTLSSGVVNYSVTIRFDMLDERILPGMSVSASLVTDTRENALSVPNAAVKGDGSAGAFVQVLKNGVPEKRSVELGLANNMRTEILSGVREGEKVIVQTLNASGVSSQSKTNGGSALPGLSGGRRIPGL